MYVAAKKYNLYSFLLFLRLHVLVKLVIKPQNMINNVNVYKKFKELLINECKPTPHDCNF